MLALMLAPSTDVLHRWVEPLGLVAMMIVALVVALLLVRRHGRSEQRKQERMERRHPFAAPVRTFAAFGVAFASALAFARIAREVVEGDTSEMDKTVELAVHSLDTPFMDHVMRAFTFMGSPFAVIPLAAAIIVWAVRKKETRAAVAFLIVLVMTEVLNVMLKSTFERPRPTLFQEIETLHSYSFPSGHAMAAAAIYGMMGVVVARLAPTHRWPLVIGLPILIVMIGMSRIYLGVHWPSDVLAGFAAGAFIVLAGALALDGIPSLATLVKPEEPAKGAGTSVVPDRL
jgi:membrane-associated phospholipid phosphatase